jgi:hypothetical protein
MTLSYIFKVEIIIMSSQTGYEHTINAFENSVDKPELKRIYLGHLGEAHYVPLDVMEAEEEEIDPIYYTYAKEKLIKWAIKMEQLQNLKSGEENQEFKEMNVDKELENNQITVSFQESNQMDITKMQQNDQMDTEKVINNPFQLHLENNEDK